MKLFTALSLLCIPGVTGFVARAGSQDHSTALRMTPEEGIKKAAVSFAAAAFLATNLVAVEPALALDHMDFGSSQVLAGRSGGRAGGRSTAARAPVRAAPSSSTTHVIHRTTYVQPAPVIVAPPVYGGYGYNPVPGLGTK